VELALTAWSWLEVGSKEPILVSAFGDVFLRDASGVWFLDTVQGKLERVCDTQSELQELLKSSENTADYLMSWLVAAAEESGLTLGPGQCYDFKVPPVLGGEVALENVHVLDFVASLDIAGQIHHQVQNMNPGTRVSKLVVTSDKKAW
jgi:Domain of unknown function (DUF1851)